MHKSLGGKRKPLLTPSSQKRGIERTANDYLHDLHVFGVIGSKGGSGEFSQVVDLVTRSKSRKWLIVSVNPDHKHEDYWQGNPLVSYKVVDWQYDDGLRKTADLAKNLEVDHLILCIGRGSRGQLYARVDRALGICDEVFVTINTASPMSMSAVAFIKEHGIERCEGSEKLRWVDLSARTWWPPT